ncbi:MAG: hypothetical protein IJP95_03665 [Bacteroidales bacterium]|nr:hypothetical protein [Bacteroidales bacterium]
MKKFTNRYIIIYAAVLVAVVAVILSVASEALRSRKEANATRRKAVEDSWRLLDALQKQVDGIALNVERRKDELLPPDED